ncbi:MAG: hypothetical protein E6R03_03715 [Hyphomicrobiaceae bacterium]|nr:MAG: hypothetical protein E6R03_03715 [Hyphomicrobiaceae bacterium]
MSREYVAAAFVGLLLLIAAGSTILGADGAPCFDSGASYRCPDCGWFVWSEGSMNRDGTYEPMVAHLRIVNHQYDCQDAQREKYAKVVAKLNARQADCKCGSCSCNRVVPQVSLEQGWKRGPLAPNTWYWGAVTLVGQKSGGFYFADFCGNYVIIDIDGKKRRIEPADVGYYNNSLRAPKRSD